MLPRCNPRVRRLPYGRAASAVIFVCRPSHVRIAAAVKYHNAPRLGKLV